MKTRQQAKTESKNSNCSSTAQNEVVVQQESRTNECQSKHNDEILSLKKKAYKYVKSNKRNFSLHQLYEILKDGSGNYLRKCLFCPAVFSTHYRLWAHISINHFDHLKNGKALNGPKNASCPICKHEFFKGKTDRVDFRAYLNHYISEHIDRRKCNLIAEENLPGMNATEKIYQDELGRVFIEYNCKTCAYQSIHKGHLDNHIARHDKIYKCYADCGEVFDNNGSLNKHKETVHLLFKCNRCGKFSEGRENRKRHSCSRRIKKSFACGVVCPICSKNISSKKNLVRHNLIMHSKNKMSAKAIANPYICYYCDFRSPVRDYFKRHMESHLNLQCPLCKKKFTRKDVYTQHLLQAHIK